MRARKVVNIYILFIFLGNGIYAIGQKDSMHFISGRSLFNTLCSPCHGVHKEIVGPMLASIAKKKKQEWLISFIQNSQNVIMSGDPYALFLYKKYNQQVMPSFSKLSGKEIENILYYIEIESLHRMESVEGNSDVAEESNGAILKGKQLFQSQCSSCHIINQESYYAPALGSITKRHSRTWLVPFIRNSQKIIKEGDPYAVDLFNAFEHRIMVPMEFLSKEDINCILDYIEFTSASDYTIAGVNGRKTSMRNNYEYPYIALPKKEIAEVKDRDSIFNYVCILIGMVIISLFSYTAIRLFYYMEKETDRLH
jgi:cytochrome c2